MANPFLAQGLGQLGVGLLQGHADETERQRQITRQNVSDKQTQDAIDYAKMQDTLNRTLKERQYEDSLLADAGQVYDDPMKSYQFYEYDPEGWLAGANHYNALRKNASNPLPPIATTPPKLPVDMATQRAMQEAQLKASQVAPLYNLGKGGVTPEEGQRLTGSIYDILGIKQPQYTMPDVPAPGPPLANQQVPQQSNRLDINAMFGAPSVAPQPTPLPQSVTRVNEPPNVFKTPGMNKAQEALLKVAVTNTDRNSLDRAAAIEGAGITPDNPAYNGYLWLDRMTGKEENTVRQGDIKLKQGDRALDLKEMSIKDQNRYRNAQLDLATGRLRISQSSLQLQRVKENRIRNENALKRGTFTTKQLSDTINGLDKENRVNQKIINEAQASLAATDDALTAVGYTPKAYRTAKNNQITDALTAISANNAKIATYRNQGATATDMGVDDMVRTAIRQGKPRDTIVKALIADGWTGTGAGKKVDSLLKEKR